MLSRLATVLLALPLLSGSAAVAGERSVTLAVENMTCVLCPITVRRAIEKVPGVLAVAVDLDAQTAVVTFDDSVSTVGQLADASTDAGYPARPAE